MLSSDPSRPDFVSRPGWILNTWLVVDWTVDPCHENTEKRENPSCIYNKFLQLVETQRGLYFCGSAPFHPEFLFHLICKVFSSNPSHFVLSTPRTAAFQQPPRTAKTTPKCMTTDYPSMVYCLRALKWNATRDHYPYHFKLYIPACTVFKAGPQKTHPLVPSALCCVPIVPQLLPFGAIRPVFPYEGPFVIWTFCRAFDSRLSTWHLGIKAWASTQSLPKFLTFESVGW